MDLKIVALLFSILVIVSASENQFCQLSCDGSINTVCEREAEKCGVGPLCGSEPKNYRLTDDERQYMLDLHNYYRNKVASGLEKPQPPAADMNALSYNKELEFVAQCWVNSCNGRPLKHDSCRRTEKYGYVGQNLGWWSSTGSGGNMLNGIKNSILGWYHEVANFNPNTTKSFQSGAKVIGHYTQLVWAKTTEIGCAVSSYTQEIDGRKWYDKILACNYGPGGNYIGQPVYRTGEPASMCSAGGPNKRYTALCGEDRPLNATEKYENAFFGISI